MNVAGLIVAAGKGTRMGGHVDKLFLEVAGQPLIVHTWRCLDSHPAIHELILVVRAEMQPVFNELAERYAFKKPIRLVLGGAERQDSVWNGLQAVTPATEIVLIQDGARPCTSADLIEQTIAAACQTGAAVAAQRVTDTIKESHDGRAIARTVDRTRLWAVQTPQTFRTDVIRAAIRTAREQGLQLTDDTAACELIGQPVVLVEGRAPNPKATSQADLPLIEMLLRGRS